MPLFVIDFVGFVSSVALARGYNELRYIRCAI
jgi:hypothetical protein